MKKANTYLSKLVERSVIAEGARNTPLVLHSDNGAARKAHPGRWTRKTRDWSLPDFVALNPTKEMKESVQEQNSSA